VKRFDEFLNEDYADHPYTRTLMRFYMLVREKYPSDSGSKLSRIISQHRDKLFDQVEMDSSNLGSISIRPGVPVLNFTEDNDLVRRMIEEGLLDRASLYNDPSSSDVVSDKVKFHREFEGEEYVPRTVFSIKDAASLKFPIVAKPANGRSAEGIRKFDSLEELESSKDDFDIFSEMVNISDEFRCFCFKDDVISLDRRVKRKGSPDFLSNVNTTTDFFYQEVDPATYEQVKSLLKLINDCRKRVPLDFFSIDFAEDPNGKLHLIEMNSRTGMGSEKMAKLYARVHEDYFNRPVDKSTSADLSRMNDEWKKAYSQEKGDVNECISVSGFLNGCSFLFKNRDRSYTPESKVVRERQDGVEIVYYTDQSGWMEGMNSHGVGFIFNQLTTKDWEGYGHSYLVTDEPKPKTHRIAKSETFQDFLEGVRKALTSSSSEEAIEKLAKAGKTGSYLVGDRNNIYELEIFDGKSEKVLRNSIKGDSGFYVKTNHGVLFPEAGHQPNGKSVKRAASSIRRHQALSQLQGLRSLDDIPTRMKFQAFDTLSSLNVFRTDDEEHTVSQCLMDLSNLRFCYHHDDETADSVRVEGNLENPVIKIEIHKHTR